MGRWSVQASLYRLVVVMVGGLLIWDFQHLIWSKSLIKSLSWDSPISQLSFSKGLDSFWHLSLIKITCLIALINIASVICPSLEKLAWLSSSYLPPPPPTAPAPLLTNPYNYVGHKGLDLAAGPKRGWAGWGAGPGWKFLLFLWQHRFQTNQNNCHRHPLPPNPLHPHHNPHDLWPVITFMLEMQPDQEWSVQRCGGEAACALGRGGIVGKELTAWMGSHLIGKNIDRSNLKRSWGGHRLRMCFVMLMCPDQIHVLIQTVAF